MARRRVLVAQRHQDGGAGAERLAALAGARRRARPSSRPSVRPCRSQRPITAFQKPSTVQGVAIRKQTKSSDVDGRPAAGAEDHGHGRGERQIGRRRSRRAMKRRRRRSAAMDWTPVGVVEVSADEVERGVRSRAGSVMRTSRINGMDVMKRRNPEAPMNGQGSADSGASRAGALVCRPRRGGAAPGRAAARRRGRGPRADALERAQPRHRAPRLRGARVRLRKPAHARADAGGRFPLSGEVRLLRRRRGRGRARRNSSGRPSSALHPHQDAFVAPAASLYAVPDAVPARRARARRQHGDGAERALGFRRRAGRPHPRRRRGRRRLPRRAPRRPDCRGREVDARRRRPVAPRLVPQAWAPRSQSRSTRPARRTSSSTPAPAPPGLACALACAGFGGDDRRDELVWRRAWSRRRSALDFHSRRLQADLLAGRQRRAVAPPALEPPRGASTRRSRSSPTTGSTR